MKPTRNLYGIHNDFCGVGGGLRRGCILIRNRDGGWGGVGMMMFFGLAHMLDATELLMFFRACTHVGCYGTADVL